MKKRLKIYDFDGTLVFTPGPDTLVNGVPALQVYDEWLVESGQPKRKWQGWWGRTETLMPPIFGVQDHDHGWCLPEELLNDELAALHAEQIQDEENLVVLMTGRHIKMKHPDRKEHVAKCILDGYGLKFEEYHFVSTGMPTLQFKCNTIEHILRENPSIREVEIWEDREAHYSKFWEFVKWLQNKQGRLDGGQVHLVTLPDRLLESHRGPSYVAS